MMDLGPGFDEALLCAWKRAADTLNRIEREHRLEFLVSRMEVRAMMGSADFGKHADDDSKEPREFRHGRTLHRHRQSCGLTLPLSRERRSWSSRSAASSQRRSSAAAACYALSIEVI